MGLTADAVTLTLGRRRVLDGVSAAFRPGRVIALLGPNGAGKSSLLRALLALVPLAAGRATLDGQDIAALDPSERARRLGYLPQAAELAWNIPARALVALGRLPHRSRFAGPTAADEAAIDSALALTDTARFADRLTATLSGGERARVMLARVLAGAPDWLLADEPLAALDPAHQIDLLARVRGLAAEGAGVIVVLHDLTQALRVADDAVLLKDGGVLAAGPADSVLVPEMLERAYGVAFERVGDALIPRAALP